VRDVERARDGESLSNALCTRAVADHHVDLVRLAAESDLGDRAAPVEALEARAVNGTKRGKRRSTRLEVAAAGGRRLPANDDNYSAFGRNRVGRDLALRRSWVRTCCSNDEERLRIDDGAVAC
jgi:hypothetical protein